MAIQPGVDNSGVVLDFVYECAQRASPYPSNETIADVTDSMEMALVHQLCVYTGHLFGDSEARALTAFIEARQPGSAQPPFDIGFGRLATRGIPADTLDDIADRLNNSLYALEARIIALLEGRMD